MSDRSERTIALTSGQAATASQQWGGLRNSITMASVIRPSERCESSSATVCPLSTDAQISHLATVRQSELTGARCPVVQSPEDVFGQIMNTRMIGTGAQDGSTRRITSFDAHFQMQECADVQVRPASCHISDAASQVLTSQNVVNAIAGGDITAMMKRFCNERKEVRPQPQSAGEFDCVTEKETIPPPNFQHRNVNRGWGHSYSADFQSAPVVTRVQTFIIRCPHWTCGDDYSRSGCKCDPATTWESGGYRVLCRWPSLHDILYIFWCMVFVVASGPLHSNYASNYYGKCGVVHTWTSSPCNGTCQRV